MNILFVCRANLCRSAMAEGIAKKLARPGAASIRSAGTDAIAGSRAANVATFCAHADGVDLNEHRSQPMTSELVAWADIIYAPTIRREKLVLTLFPEAGDKVVQLDALAEFPDPIGASDMEVYTDLYARLKRVIAERFTELGLL